jgi:hypothetical protein
LEFPAVAASVCRLHISSDMFYNLMKEGKCQLRSSGLLSFHAYPMWFPTSCFELLSSSSCQPLLSEIVLKTKYNLDTLLCTSKASVKIPSGITWHLYALYISLIKLNVFSKSMKAAYRVLFHSLGCFKIIWRELMRSVELFQVIYRSSSAEELS